MTRPHHLVGLAVTLGACAAPSSPAQDDADHDSAEPAHSGGSDSAAPSPSPAPDYSGGACPTLVAGTNTFATGDTTYSVEVWLPPAPDGAPLLFAWHSLGNTATGIVSGMGLEPLVAAEGIILIAPQSSGAPTEWRILDTPTNNPDYRLFEDLLACAWSQWGVDLDRVWSTGMSAGGLWTSYLSMHGSTWLAATAPMSGGSTIYNTPDEPIPVMLTWGGEADTYDGLSFDRASINLSEGLLGDGSFVVECVHDRGHALPPWGFEPAWTFLKEHPKGVTPEPWAGGLPASMPAECHIP